MQAKHDPVCINEGVEVDGNSHGVAERLHSVYTYIHNRHSSGIPRMRRATRRNTAIQVGTVSGRKHPCDCLYGKEPWS